MYVQSPVTGLIATNFFCPLRVKYIKQSELGTLLSTDATVEVVSASPFSTGREIWQPLTYIVAAANLVEVNS